MREKIGQMLILGFDGKTKDEVGDIKRAIEDDNIGGVILFDYDFKTKQFDKNIQSPTQVKTLNQFLQYTASKANANHSRPDVPLYISVDYEGGKVDRLKKNYGFPRTFSSQELSQFSKEKRRESVKTMAQTLELCGFNLNFAPVVDVNTNPLNPIIGALGRSYCSMPEQVIDYAKLVVAIMRQHKVQSVFKHFPGHGSSKSDSHLDFVDVSNTWDQSELLPYDKQLTNDVMVMTGHITNTRLDSDKFPATLSEKMVGYVLRQTLGFSGVVISDDMQMRAITKYYGMEQAILLAINAGVNMLIFGNQLTKSPVSANYLIDVIEKYVKQGDIKASRIDEAYERIIKQKTTLMNNIA